MPPFVTRSCLHIKGQCELCFKIVLRFQPPFRVGCQLGAVLFSGTHLPAGPLLGPEPIACPLSLRRGSQTVGIKEVLRNSPAAPSVDSASIPAQTFDTRQQAEEEAGEPWAAYRDAPCACPAGFFPSATVMHL